METRTISFDEWDSFLLEIQQAGYSFEESWTPIGWRVQMERKSWRELGM